MSAIFTGLLCSSLEMFCNIKQFTPKRMVIVLDITYTRCETDPSQWPPAKSNTRVDNCFICILIFFLITIKFSLVQGAFISIYSH